MSEQGEAGATRERSLSEGVGRLLMSSTGLVAVLYLMALFFVAILGWVAFGPR